jgi:Na+/H+ antiporter NhaC
VGGATATFTAGLMISKEKLAFLVDCTSAPIASLVPISTWVGYEVGLIQDALDSIGSDKRAFDLFMKSIPYRFYALFMLIFVFTVLRNTQAR